MKTMMTIGGLHSDVEVDVAFCEPNETSVPSDSIVSSDLNESSDPNDTDDDNTPLVPVASPRRKQPTVPSFFTGRTFIVEPLVFLQILSTIPLDTVNQFFLYGKMQEVVAGRSGQNLSTLAVHHYKNSTTNNFCKPTSDDVGNTSSLHQNFTNQVQIENANFNMISFVVMTMPTLISTILLSAYSDKRGRKIAIVPPVVASTIYAVIYFIVILLDLSPWVILIGHFLNGLSGNYHLMMAGCSAYISDTTTKEQRQTRMTLLNLVHLVPHLLASIGIGHWVQNQGFIWPTLLAVVGQILCLVYAVFLIPETITTATVEPFFTVRHLKDGINIFLKKRTDSTARLKLWILLLIVVLYVWGTGAWSAMSLFELNAPFCWDVITVSYYHTVNTAVTALGGMAVAVVMKRLATDEVTAILGGISYTAAYVYLANCRNTIMMFFRPSFNIFAVQVLPTTKTLLSKQVSRNQQGSLFGVIANLEALAGFAGNEFFVFVYSKTLHISTTFVFYITAGLYLIVTIIYILYTCLLTGKTEKKVLKENRKGSLDK